MLRPARPGAAYLAVRTGAKILPVAFTGFRDIFPLRLRNKAKVIIRIGKPYGPLKTDSKGRKKREELDMLGDKIMEEIAALLPDEYRGKFSSDPEVRRKAEEVSDYPWEKANWDEV